MKHIIVVLSAVFLFAIVGVSCASKTVQLSRETTLLAPKELNQLEKLVSSSNSTITFSADASKFRVASRGYSNQDRTVRINMEIITSPAERIVRTDFVVTSRHNGEPGIIETVLVLDGQEFSYPSPDTATAKTSGSGIVTEKITCVLEEDARKALGKACSVKDGVCVKVTASDGEHVFTLPEEALTTIKGNLTVNNYLRSCYR